MINIETRGGEKTFLIGGDLDQHTMREFSEIIHRELGETGDWDFLIDLDRTTFVDSGCLGVISQANRELTGRGRRLRLLNVHSGVAATLNVTSLDKIFDIEYRK